MTLRACAIVASLAACAGAAGRDSAGNAAQIICAAECRRSLRCGQQDLECPGRCDRLPVRRPAVWSASWADEIAHCFDTSSCAHDAEEGCVFATARRTHAAQSCASAAKMERRLCPVLNGLTDDASNRVDTCFAGDKVPPDTCLPEFDWK
jgi:hypothetical protein